MSFNIFDRVIIDRGKPTEARGRVIGHATLLREEKRLPHAIDSDTIRQLVTLLVVELDIECVEPERDPRFG